MSDETLELLKRVAKDVADIKAAMAASVGASGAMLGVSSGGGGGSAGAGGVATASEMDADYGDPVVKRDPGRWAGESFVGKKFSETTPEYLDCMADLKEWAANKDDAAGAKDGKGRPKSYFARKDARLCRGWAARLRSGWKPTNGGGGAPQVKDEDYDDAGFGGDSEIPF